MYNKKYYWEHRLQRQEYQRQYYKTHPELKIKRRISDQRRYEECKENGIKNTFG